MSIQSKTRPHTYKLEEDIEILKEVIMVRPFGSEKTKIWEEIHLKLKIPVADGKCLKRHYDGMQKAFKIQNIKSLRASGTEEEYSEKLQLLQDAWDLEEAETANHTQILNDKAACDKKKLDTDKEVAEKIRTGAMERIVDDGEPAKKKKKFDLTEVLIMREEENAKLEREKLELRKLELENANFHTIKKLELEERRLTLEEGKLYLQRMEYSDKRELEKQKLVLELEEKKRMMGALFRNYKSQD